MSEPLFPHEDEMRRQVRQQVAQAIPAEAVDEVTDLAFHAAREAMDKLFLVAGTASSAAIGKCSATIAFGLLGAACAAYERNAKALALENGAHIVQGEVSVSGARA